MSTPAVFDYSGQQVRTVLVDGEPWFVAADVCAVLGYANSRDAVSKHVPQARRGMSRFATASGEQQMTVISEPGLYRLIMRSNAVGAETFQEWVTAEVLPTIRRTGQFGSQVPASFAEALELAAAQQRAIEAAEAKILADAPKVAAFDKLMDADGYYDMGATGKVLGIGRTTLFRRLRDEGVLQRGSNLPYQRYAHHFKVTASSWTSPDGDQHTSYTTRVRPSGLAFLARRLGVVLDDTLAIDGAA